MFWRGGGSTVFHQNFIFTRIQFTNTVEFQQSTKLLNRIHKPIIYTTRNKNLILFRQPITGVLLLLHEGILSPLNCQNFLLSGSSQYLFSSDDRSFIVTTIF